MPPYNKKGHFIPNIQKGLVTKVSGQWVETHKALIDSPIPHPPSDKILHLTKEVIISELVNPTPAGTNSQLDHLGVSTYKWIGSPLAGSILGFTFSNYRVELSNNSIYTIFNNYAHVAPLPKELEVYLLEVFSTTPTKFKTKHVGFSTGELEATWLSQNPNSTILMGTDESGTGSMVGPIITCSVVCDMANPPPLLARVSDSKCLQVHDLEKLHDDILNCPELSVHVAEASNSEIDSHFQQAHTLAFSRAIEGHPRFAECQHILIDGTGLKFPYASYSAVAKGESKSQLIAAASIIATYRQQQYALTLHELYPHYSFDTHHGHPTPTHLNALKDFGPIPEHRRCFKPVRLADTAQPSR